MTKICWRFLWMTSFFGYSYKVQKKSFIRASKGCSYVKYVVDAVYDMYVMYAVNVIMYAMCYKCYVYVT